ncbi:MAG: hypothetical protein Kow0042_01010 [Calditrichia bacterium]
MIKQSQPLGLITFSESMTRDKIKKLPELIAIRKELRKKKKVVVFTNGVFDILHRGHVEYLEAARSRGDILILGLNSDQSVERWKGAGRPLMTQEDRATILAALESVDYVCVFDEDTPEKLITALVPDILIKGGDYRIEDIVGREVVWEHGGRVETIPLTPGRSTTDLIRKIGELIKNGVLNL